MTATRKPIDLLEGAELDRAVAVLEGFGKHGPPYSTSWELAGPIIEREEIGLWRPGHPHYGQWAAESEELNRKTAGIGSPKYGPTPLIAAMRAFVASKTE